MKYGFRFTCVVQLTESSKYIHVIFELVELLMHFVDIIFWRKFVGFQISSRPKKSPISRNSLSRSPYYFHLKLVTSFELISFHPAYLQNKSNSSQKFLSQHSIRFKLQPVVLHFIVEYERHKL